MVTQLFDPEPTFKGMVFARAMHERGFEVEVVTGFPNYPGGRLYPGYRLQLIRREIKDNVSITRLPLFPSHDQNAIRRSANYISFCISVSIYLTLFAKRADIVYVYHPPLTVGLAAAFAKIFRKTPMVIDIQDMWPDTLKATGMIRSNWILKIVDVFCRWLYRQVSHIVVLSPGFRKLLIARGVPENKITTIMNWADEAAIISPKGQTSIAIHPAGKFRVLFAGNMGRAQALDNVIDAARIVAENCSIVEFVFLGGGLEVNHLKKRATDTGLSNVIFLPPVPMADVGSYLAAADCLLVHLRDDPLFAVTIPSKTQAYMAAGKPIIIAVEGNAAELITQSNSGIAVPPNNPGALSEAVLRLARCPKDELERMGSAAKDFYDANMSLARGADAFASLFRQTLVTK
jgi:glycosyltransferase involved in cell wall biosynthesis